VTISSSSAWVDTHFYKSNYNISYVIGDFRIGIAITQYLVYIGELSEEDICGILGTMIQLLQMNSVLFRTSTSSRISIFPVVLYTAMLWYPETPYFFIMKDRRDKVQRRLIRLHGAVA
jgi:hypothetical protein